MNDELSNLLAKLIAALALMAVALGISYLQMTYAWGLELKSIGWFIGTSLLSGGLVAVINALNIKS
jgi:uncharacterized membrane protein YgdD (TMEM256/DUF423 family)